jgi:hypothetical protein
MPRIGTVIREVYQYIAALAAAVRAHSGRPA